MEKQNKYKKILRITIPVTLLLIWGNSIMPGTISGDISGGLMKFLKSLLGIKSTESNTMLHFIIRKIGHFSEFAVLGLQVSIYNYKDIKKYLSSIVLCGLFVALIDETIQLFVKGRAGLVADVWIDLAGYLIGISVVAIGQKRKLKKHKY